MDRLLRLHRLLLQLSGETVRMLQLLLRLLERHAKFGLVVAQAKHLSVDLIALELHSLVNLKLEAAVCLLELLDV